MRVFNTRMVHMHSIKLGVYRIRVLNAYYIALLVSNRRYGQNRIGFSSLNQIFIAFSLTVLGGCMMHALLSVSLIGQYCLRELRYYSEVTKFEEYRETHLVIE